MCPYLLVTVVSQLLSPVSGKQLARPAIVEADIDEAIFDCALHAIDDKRRRLGGRQLARQKRKGKRKRAWSR